MLNSSNLKRWVPKSHKSFLILPPLTGESGRDVLGFIIDNVVNRSFIANIWCLLWHLICHQAAYIRTTSWSMLVEASRYSKVCSCHVNSSHNILALRCLPMVQDWGGHKVQAHDATILVSASISPVEGPESPLLWQVEETEWLEGNEGQMGDRNLQFGWVTLRQGKMTDIVYKFFVIYSRALPGVRSPN